MKRFFAILLLLIIALEAKAQNFQQSPYVSGIPLNLIERVGRQKQDAYNNNLEEIQLGFNRLNKMNNKLFKNYPDEYKYYSKKIKDFIQSLNSHQLDYSHNPTANAILNKIDEIEEEMYTDYENL